MLGRLPASIGEMETKLTQSQKEMDRVKVSGVVRLLSFKAGGTKCDASVGRSVVLAMALPAGAEGTGALGLLWAWPAGWLAGCLVPRQDWCGRVWNQRDFSCKLAQ